MIGRKGGQLLSLSSDGHGCDYSSDSIHPATIWFEPQRKHKLSQPCNGITKLSVTQIQY